MKINLSDKEINLLEKALVALAKNEKGNNFDIITLMNKLITAEETAFYTIVKEKDIHYKTLKRVDKDKCLKNSGMMIAEYIKELHNLKGEARYVGNNKYRIGDYILKLESLVTKIDTENDNVIAIVNYRINGDNIGKMVVRSKFGKVIDIETV